MHCLKYGLTVHNVLRVRGYTIDGEPVDFGSEALDSPGYDLLALAIGSEGLLAVITEVTVKLLPKPESARVVMASFDDVEKAGDAVAAVIAAGIIPAGLEMMDRPATAAVEQFVHAGYDLEAAAILLCESDGSAAEVEDEIARMKEVLAAAGATRCTVSRDEAERLRFWSGRKAAFPAVGRISPDYYCMDGTIPQQAPGRSAQLHRRDGEEVRPALPERVPRRRRQPASADPVRRQRSGAAQAHRGVRRRSAGEVRRGRRHHHRRARRGRGEDRPDVRAVRPGELEIFHAIKRAFDPQGLLNPGKAVPALARCAEFGRMHVHGGKLHHPDLPRF